jgi:hypothetical protein
VDLIDFSEPDEEIQEDIDIGDVNELPEQGESIGLEHLSNVNVETLSRLQREDPDSSTLFKALSLQLLRVGSSLWSLDNVSTLTLDKCSNPILSPCSGSSLTSPISISIAIDIVGPLSRTKKGNKYILTVIDEGTRYPEAFPLPSIEAERIAQSLVQSYITTTTVSCHICKNTRPIKRLFTFS